MGTVLTVDADVNKLKFSRTRCFAGEIGPEQQRCLDILAEFICSREQPLAFYGAGDLCRIILDYAPRTRALVQCILDDNPELHAKFVDGSVDCRHGTGKIVGSNDHREQESHIRCLRYLDDCAKLGLEEQSLG